MCRHSDMQDEGVVSCSFIRVDEKATFDQHWLQTYCYSHLAMYSILFWPCDT